MSHSGFSARIFSVRIMSGVLLLLAGTLVQATPNAASENEIRHLIDFVAGSGCTFFRNGDAHPSRDASEHLAMKYGKARKRLSTPEEFIEHVASGSYFTGKEYRVQCPGKPEQTSRAWLMLELQQSRSKAVRQLTSMSSGNRTSIATGR